MAGAQRSADVVIVGGGVVGCAAAWFAAREGLRVCLLERDELASQASGAAAGMLCPIGEGEPASPLLRFGLESLGGFAELCEELRERSGIDPEYEATGLLRVAQSEDEERALRERLAALEPLGLDLEWVDAAAMAAIQPGLARDVRGASWSPAEANLRSPLLARAYAGAARSLGAEVATGQPVVGVLCDGARVTGVRTSAGAVHAGHVVIASGAWCGALEDWLPRELRSGRTRGGPAVAHVEPLRGQIVALEGARVGLRTMVWGHGAYLVPKRDGTVVVGATEERVGFDCRVTAEGVAQLLAGAVGQMPGLATAGFLRGWAGLRPESPDGMPAIGAHPGVEGLILAIGHHRSGVLLSPTTGRLVRDCVLGKDPGPAARAFTPERWARSGHTA